MDIGIGLPVTVPGTPPEDLMAWGRLAEDAGFASVATLDRIAYPNYDPLIALAATAAATRRIRLATTVLLGPARGAGPVLVKQIASLHRLSGQRLVLGLAVGARPNDYEAAGEPFHRRGRRIEELVALLRAAADPATAGLPPTAGVPGSAGVPSSAGVAATLGAVSPPMPDGGPPLLLGGHSDTAIARAARLATGWISGGSSGQPYQERADRVRKAWVAAGRDGEPRLVALLYFALGPAAPARIERTLGAFYAGTGPYGARAIAEALSTSAAIADAVAEHADAGCHELVFMPCASSVDQIDRLRAALR